MMLFLIEDIIAGANFCDATDMDPEANSEGQAKAENTLAAECRASKLRISLLGKERAVWSLTAAPGHTCFASSSVINHQLDSLLDWREIQMPIKKSHC